MNNLQNKLKKIIERNEKIIVLILIIIAVSAFTFNVVIDANDELWNFSNTYKIANGEILYKDCNVIVTPLFFYLGEILFKILGANYCTFRIYNCIIYTTLYYLIYCILRRLEIEKTKAFTYLMLIYFITCKFITIGANYNMLAIVFVAIGILVYLRQDTEKQHILILQGAIAFLVSMCKQNIGVLYIIGLIFYQLIQKENWKNKLKIVIKQLGIFAILWTIYFIYLYATSNLYNFINYTVLGLIEFRNKNLLFDSSVYILITEIVVSSFMIYVINSKKIKIESELKNRMILLLSFSIAMLFIAYPIFNKGHVIISITFMMLSNVYFIDKILLKDLLEHKNIIMGMKIINVIAIIIILVLQVKMNGQYLSEIQQNQYKCYYGGRLKNQEQIENIIQYIESQQKEGKEVIIVSYKANLYNNILNKNHGNLDLPFHGNLGIEGEDGLIKQIEKLENTNILITKKRNRLSGVSKSKRLYYEKF